MSMSIKERLGRLEPTTLEADTSNLSEATRRALGPLADAIRGMDRLFQRQMSDYVVEMAERIAEGGELSEDERRAFRFFNGPYDSLADHEPFLPGAPPLPPGRALYPADLTEDQLDRTLEQHPDKRDELLDPYTVVAREGDDLVAIPYGRRFARDIEPVAKALRAAAGEVDHDGLAAFLRGRADALLGESGITGSDAEWVRLTGAPLEVVIGPFEVYEDQLKGQKAFYEGMLLAVDQDACDRLKQIEAALPELASMFPVPAGSRPAMGGMAPLIVADELLTGGEAHAGILASAFNLPNDAGVRAEVGWKQIMIRNVMQAKFDACTRPIARRVLSPDDFEATSFAPYFYHVLLHEVSHGLGPAYRKDGRRVSEACGRHYTPLEEAKADTGSLHLLLKLNGRFGIPELSRTTIGASYFGGFFRSVRFGLHEAHGKANVIQYSFLREQGAVVQRGDRMGVDPDKLAAAAETLLDELTRLQAEGTEQELADFIGRYGDPPSELEETVESLTDLPIDILPTFPLDAP